MTKSHFLATNLVSLPDYVWIAERLLLWEKSRRDDMLNLLRGSGYGENEAFYRVAQAISETLPIESREKKLLDGFLYHFRIEM